MTPHQAPRTACRSLHHVGRVLMLAVLLLLAQHGGVLHELNHHATRAAHAASDEQARPVGEVCDICFGYAPVATGAAVGAATPPLLAVLSFAATDASLSVSRAAEVPALRSRGPPGTI